MAYSRPAFEKRYGAKKQSVTATNVAAFSYLEEKCQLFGRNVRRLRKERRFSSEVLAHFLNISTAYVGLIERGERCPSLETFFKICDFFGESYEVMMAEPESKTATLRDGEVLTKEQAAKLELQTKQKTVHKMTDTFNISELELIESIIKSLRNFSHLQRMGLIENEPTDADDDFFDDDDDDM